jgi:hypothetical protein
MCRRIDGNGLHCDCSKSSTALSDRERCRELRKVSIGGKKMRVGEW